MRAVLMAGLASGALIAPAMAADLPLKAPTLMPMMMSNWGGLYLGFNGGGGWADTTWSFPVNQFLATAPGQGFSTDPSGGLIGGHIGYNWQNGVWVFGAEFTGDWADLRETRIGPVTPAFPADSFTTKLQDLETFTGRLGYAAGTWMFYGKGGLGTGSLAFSGISGPPVPNVVFSDTERMWGPTAGAGIEFMWTPNMIVGVEYDFTHLVNSSFNTSGFCTVAATCGTGSPPVIVSNNNFDVSSIVGRISYKFGY